MTKTGKESKECEYWIRLIIDTGEEGLKGEGLALRDEAVELRKIFSSIISKCG